MKAELKFQKEKRYALISIEGDFNSVMKVLDLLIDDTKLKEYEVY